MGLFNRKKKEEVEFNYDEMMAAAKLEYPRHSPEYYFRTLLNLVKSNEFSFVYKTQTSSNDINERFLKSQEETNCIGVYDKNDNLLLTFEIDTDKLILYRYLIYNTNISREASIFFEKIDMQPIKNVVVNEDLLTNYSIEDVLSVIISDNWSILPDDITSGYINEAIKMYISNKNK